MTKTFVTGEVLTASDVNTYLVNNGYQYAGTKYFTSSGTFAKADPLGTGDIGLRAIRVRLVGGGGGGGGASGVNTDGSGGGGGGYAETFHTDIASLSASETVTVGAGGAGGAGGGSSSFGTIAAADGGNGGHTGGSHNNNFGAYGGLGTTGDYLERGGNGGTAGRGRIGAGYGGSTKFGAGASQRWRRDSGAANGLAGLLYGSGGGGGSSSDGTAAAGGAGANGIVIVECYV